MPSVKERHMLDKDRAQSIYRISLLVMIANALLAASKIAIGIGAGSLAVTSDGLDSAVDIIASFVTLAASLIISKPPDIRHPYGHRRAEAIATKIVAFLIFFIGAQLIISTVERILRGELRELPAPLALYITVVSIIGKAVLSYLLFRQSRRTGSSMLKANANNMRNDIFISVAVLAGLVFTFILSLPLIDYLLAILVSLWIIKSAIQIFWESTLETMDGVQDENLYSVIFAAVEEIPGASHPHRTRIRSLGDMYIISLDIEVAPTLSVAEGHRIALQVEDRISTTIGNVYDVVVHVEPRGNVERNEKYGLSRQNIDDRS